MLLSHKTVIKVNDNYANIIGHMCYAAYKLWNVCNYERLHHNELNLPVKYPDWYYQKAAHKNDLWFKQLPSQTAQEVCKLLDKSWKSFYVLKQTGGIINPRPPKFKHEAIAVTYMQNGITHTSDTVRLTLSKGLKRYMTDEYNINENYLFLKNRIFKDISVIKQLKIYPPKHNKCTVIVSYEVPDVTPLPDNGKYLSIDIGIHNLLTCYVSDSQETFIIGRKYLSICNYYYKETARVQSQWSLQQSRKGVKYPRISKHVQKLYARKNNTISDYLHKITKYIVNYCISNDIHTVVIGDITNIRKDKDLGDITNQKLHSLPFKRIYQMFEYKLKSAGIRLIKQNEAYSSQTSPLADKVCRQNADKKKRVYRGLFIDGNNIWNADCVGAYNILRLYLKNNAIGLNPYDIKVPYIVKVDA